MDLNSISDLDEALEALEDLVGILQDLHYKMTSIEDFNEYGVVNALIEFIEESLIRYDSL
jgi:hypothetical protein